MNQGLAYEVEQVMPQAVQTSLFVSLCTFQQPDGIYGPSGAPSGTFVNVSGLVDIACMDSVPSEMRVQATEVRDLAEIMATGQRHMLLDGYYPEATPDGQIPTNWRAVVDGVAYDILGVEHDSQNTQTRLEMKIVVI